MEQEALRASWAADVWSDCEILYLQRVVYYFSLYIEQLTIPELHVGEKYFLPIETKKPD